MDAKCVSHCLLVCACTVLGCAENGHLPQDTAPITLQAESRVTTGFPVVLRITARGPQRVPRVDLFDGGADVVVEIASKNGVDNYFILSRPNLHLQVTDEHGNDRPDIERDEAFPFLKDGETRTMLLDLASLTPRPGERLGFGDVPPGQYRVTVTFPESGESSGPVDMGIVAPTEAEREFLRGVSELSMYRWGNGVRWSKVLLDKLEIRRDGLDRLSKTARRQLMFHLLLIDVLSSSDPIDAASIDRVRRARVPDYLQPEKECLLLEMKAATGRLQKKDVAELRARYPGLGWRLDRVESGGKDFLAHKRRKP